MSKQQTPTLDEAVAAAKQLPENAQTVIAQEIAAMVKGDVFPPPRSEKEQAIINERMSKPRTHVSRDDFMTMLRKFHPSL